MKINILSTGRFHVCDLTRELESLGFDVVFYSFVSSKRLRKFGLSPHSIRSLFFPLAPFAYLERKIAFRNSFFCLLRRWLQDHLTALTMRRAEVVIAMSGEFNHSLKIAKKRGSLIICERGSMHILDQKELLEANPFVSKRTIDQKNIDREMVSYSLADYLAVASSHVADSFIKRGFPPKQLFVNPYGVSTHSFHPQPTAEIRYDFIMVGTWGYQKGCDILVEAIQKTGYTLLHVGAIGDMPFPTDAAHFTHISPVDEPKLVHYYAMAKVFILPSRQEGLAMVQAQAIACNLPMIGSVNSGAVDLKAMVSDSRFISYIDTFHSSAIVEKMEQMQELYRLCGKQNYAGESLENMTWSAYGRRYAAFLNQLRLV